MAAARGALNLDARGGVRARGGARSRGHYDPRPLPIAARVTFYGAPGCHLCDAARRVVEDVRRQIAFELEEIDISTDPELERRFRERIPVVAVDGEEAFAFFVHPDGLHRRLTRSHKVTSGGGGSTAPL